MKAVMRYYVIAFVLILVGISLLGEVPWWLTLVLVAFGLLSLCWGRMNDVDNNMPPDLHAKVHPERLRYSTFKRIFDPEA